MARAHRYEMLPHVHALLALVEKTDALELLFARSLRSWSMRLRSSSRTTLSAARTTSRA